MDDQVLATELNGRAIAIDPGTHVFQFELSPYPPVKETVVVRESENNRVISVDFTPGETAEFGSTAQSAPVVRGPVPLTTYVLGGAGLASIAAFVVFSQSAMADTHALGCAPFCSTSTVAPIRTKYAVGDAFLGVGVLSLSLATYFFLTRPPRRPDVSSSLTTRFEATVVASSDSAGIRISGGF